MPRPPFVTPELHNAGATVLHRSPFDELVVPVSTEPLAIDLRERWVRPLYMTVPRVSPVVRRVLLSQLHEIGPELIEALLAEFNWRPRKVGAFLVALDQRVDFEELIGKLLLRSDVCYAGLGYCVALACLNTQSALGFLQEYLQYYLRRPDLHFDQAVALAAVKHLDETNGTRHAEEFDPLWTEFTHDKPHWDSGGVSARFGAMMVDVATLRAACSLQRASAG